MSENGSQILIVEDNQELADLIAIHLKDLGFLIDHCKNGNDGLEAALNRNYELVIMDVMMPGKDGFEVTKAIREKNKQLPILMLTAKAEEIDKIMGLEFGADDYLTKPFSIRELTARVKALLRRVKVGREFAHPPQEKIQIGEMEIYPSKRSLKLREQLIELTTKEFDLLLLFAQNPGTAYSRQKLLDVVWGYRYSGYSHTVNSHINRLRAKIEPDPANPKYIKTVWGTGYRFAESDEI